MEVEDYINKHCIMRIIANGMLEVRSKTGCYITASSQVPIILEDSIMTLLASHEVTKLGCYKDFASESTDVACFGFSETEQKWYGWSHRAFIGFGIGYVAKRGDVAVEYGNIPDGFEAKTLDDAKECAITFASYIA